MASSLNNLATLYEDMAQYAKAEPLYQRSLKIREAKLGPDHPDVAGSLDNLANLYYAMGQNAKAEPLFQRSLKINEAKLGPDHPDVASSLNNLANLYKDMAQYAKAEPLYQRSLKIKRSEAGTGPPRCGCEPQQPGETCTGQGHYAKAEPLYQRSLKISEAKLGPDHPDVADSLNNLAIAVQGRRVNMRKRSRSTSEASRSRKRSWDRITPTWPVASTTWRTYYIDMSRNARKQSRWPSERSPLQSTSPTRTPQVRYRCHDYSRSSIAWGLGRPAPAVEDLGPGLGLH